jgi:iron-sulfur cluster assembly accessory protein
MRKTRPKDSRRGKFNKSLNVIPNTTVTVTDEAAAKIREALNESPSAGIRIHANQNERGTVSFTLNLEDEIRSDDLVLDQKGIKFFIDGSTARHMQGMEIRYVTTERGSGFAIWNLASG